MMKARATTRGLALLGVAVVATACGGSGHSTKSGAGTTTAQPGADASSAAVHVVSVAPRKLSPMSAITVTYSGAVTSSTATPTLSSSAVSGSWTRSGDTAVFTPTRAYPPDTTISVRGSKVTGGRVKTLAKRATPHGSLIRAEQILATLHYLPLASTATEPSGATAQAAAVYSPPSGSFHWRYSNVPASLKAGWSAKNPGNVLRGAVIAFQHQAGLPLDGAIGPMTWRALLKAEAGNKTDPDHYSYVYANLYPRPQTLSVWVDGKTVVSSPVNGGVASAPTPLGTYAVYERFTSTTMQGTNPDGSKYKDPGVPWVNYFSGGSAVHGFPRSSYGSPQSVGCLELPIPTAKQVFGMIDYGTLVTVVGPTIPTPVVTATPSAPSSSKPTHSPSPKPTPTPTKSKKKH